VVIVESIERVDARRSLSSFTAISLTTYTLPWGADDDDRRGEMARRRGAELVSRPRKKASRSPMVCDSRSAAMRLAAHKCQLPLAYPSPAVLISPEADICGCFPRRSPLHAARKTWA
jgi:hypothetical protein